MLSNFGATKFDSAVTHAASARHAAPHAVCVAMLARGVAAGAARSARHPSGDALVCAHVRARCRASRPRARAARCRRRLAQPAARASPRRRRTRRRSPRGAMRFRPIACCRRSSTGGGSRSPSRWRSRLQMQCSTRACAAARPAGRAAAGAVAAARARVQPGAGDRAPRRRAHRRAADAGLCAAFAIRRRRPALPLAARARNVRGAFEAVTRLDGLAVAIVDDVMTTGATLGGRRRRARERPVRDASRRGSSRARLPPSQQPPDAASDADPDVRRRPRAPGDSAQHRQRDPAHREHGDRAASSSSRWDSGWTTASCARAGLDYHEYARVHVHRDFAACRAALDRDAPRRWFAFTTQASALGVRRRVRAGRRADVRLRNGRPARRGARAFAARRAAAHSDAPRRAQPQPVERRRGRGVRGVAAGGIRAVR